LISIPHKGGADQSTLKIPGSLKDTPSSARVTSYHWMARISANSARASVIMAKKMALTLSEKKAMTRAMEILRARATPVARTTWYQLGGPKW
jgi:hypothetical protein